MRDRRPSRRRRGAAPRAAPAFRQRGPRDVTVRRSRGRFLRAAAGEAACKEIDVRKFFWPTSCFFAVSVVLAKCDTEICARSRERPPGVFIGAASRAAFFLCRGKARTI